MNPYERTRTCVAHYRQLGLCPLPSRMDVKGPFLKSYAEHYQGVPVPSDAYAVDTTNVQIICGTKSPTPTRIIVIDLDGPAAADAWERITAHHGNYRTRSAWIVKTGSGGRHIYFLLPDELEAAPSGLMWAEWDTWGDDGKGKWKTHSEIRLLGDNSLVIAPPSIHVKTGQPYEFIGDRSPNRIYLPEVVPSWILDMPRLVAPRCVEPPKPVYMPRAPRRSGLYYDRDEVLNAISDKLALAKQWGLRTSTDHPNLNGWVACFVPGREDPRHSSASGSFSVRDGVFQDRRDLKTISLFDLGVLLQPARWQNWISCRDELGDRYLGKS